MPDQAEDLGQATLTMHATVLGHAHFTDDQGCRWDDEVSITVSERVQFRIVAIPTGALKLKMMSHQNNFIVGGGGKAKGKLCDATWTYHSKEHVESSLIGVWVNLGTGRGGFMISSNFIKDAELETTMSGQGITIPNASIWFAGSAAMAAVDDPVTAMSQAAKNFLKQLKFSFKPYAKNVSARCSADSTYQLPTPGTPGSAELHMDFSLTTGAQEDSEAEILPPKEYTHWQPKAGDDEVKPGNTITVRAWVHKKGDPKTTFYKKAKFKFQLVDVSREKGVCLNWPQKQSLIDDADLKIEPKTNSSLKVAGDGQSAESAAGKNESSVTITAHDWGAYGKLKVTVVFDDGQEQEAHVQGDQSKYSLAIPQDDNANHIADIWEKLFPIASYDAKADDDLYPVGDNSLGDGLSLYEEYRGFREQGQHIFLNPIQKDLFVYDATNRGPGDSAQSGLTIHFINDKEAGLESTEPNPWVINANRGFASRGPQHILRIINEKLEGYFGLTYGFGTPKKIEIIKIDVGACLKAGVSQLDRTFAHELAHGCSVDHHGESDYDVFAFEILDAEDGSWVKSPKKGPFYIAAQGGQESGVEQCLMRYRSANFFETPNGLFRWGKKPGEWRRGELYGEDEDTGHIFCDDPKGTGVNAPHGYNGVSKAGNATIGNCKGQFCVNDNKG